MIKKGLLFVRQSFLFLPKFLSSIQHEIHIFCFARIAVFCSRLLEEQ